MDALSHATLVFDAALCSDLVSGDAKAAGGGEYRLLQMNDDLMTALKAGDRCILAAFAISGCSRSCPRTFQAFSEGRR